MSTSFVYADPPGYATHSALDYFTTSQILIDFQRGYDEIVYPPSNPDGPVLEFEFQAPKTEVGGSVVDLKNIFLKLEVQLEKHTGTAADQNAVLPIFVNNLGQSLFQNVEILLNGTQVSTSLNLHPYKAMLEADLSYDPAAKHGILCSQGYYYEPDPTQFAATEDETKLKNGFEARREIVKTRKSWNYYFTVSDSFLLGTHNYLLPGVELRMRLTRATDQFVLLQPDEALAAKDFSIKINSASLYVHMLELRNQSFLSIEKGLTKRAAVYEFKETLPKSFLISDGTSVFYKDDIFSRAPVNRITLAMVPEDGFTGNYDTNPFDFTDFNLDTVRLMREGSTVGNTPLEVGKSHVRAYYTTLRNIGLEHGANGITLEQFEHHFCLVFQLTADLQIDDNTIRPELTGGRLAVELKFSKPTEKPIRLLLLGERRSVVFIDRNREVIKNSKVYNG